MPTDPAFPDVPADRLRDGGWELVDESVETVFQLPTARVEGATKVYDAAETREAVRDAVGLDHQWRFFFATALSFTPPLAPGIGPAVILPTVRSEAQSAFADELADRGFESVERGRSERVRVDSGDRARLRTYSAELDLEAADATLSITAGSAFGTARGSVSPPARTPTGRWRHCWILRIRRKRSGGRRRTTGPNCLTSSAPWRKRQKRAVEEQFYRPETESFRERARNGVRAEAGHGRTTNADFSRQSGRSQRRGGVPSLDRSVPPEASAAPKDGRSTATRSSYPRTLNATPSRSTVRSASTSRSGFRSTWSNRSPTAFAVVTTVSRYRVS